MGLSYWHVLIVVLVFVVLFGRGKISELMGDVAHGIKSFKKGLVDDESSELPESPKVRKPLVRRQKAARNREGGGAATG